jgi:hypothetical protein
MENSFARVGACLAAALILVAGVASAQVTNGSFESGDLTGWSVDMGAVEVVQPSNFSTSIPTVDGNYYVLLSTTPDQSSGVDSGQDRDGVDGNEQDVAILSQTFNVPSVPNTLHFSVAMLTAEAPEDDSADIIECTVDGNQVAHAGTSNNSAYTSSGFPFAGPFSGSYTVSSPGATNGSAFGTGVTVFHEITVPISTAGNHTLECYLGDGFGDGEVDSGLLLDDVYLEQSVPTVPRAGLALLALLLAGAGAAALKRT